MDLTKMLAELKLQREKLDCLIEAAEDFARGSVRKRGRPPAWMKRRGRPPGSKNHSAAATTT
jgi:hypothetical protein